MKNKILLTFLLFILSGFIYIFIFLKPSNDRNWEVGLEKLPTITIEDNIVDIKDERDYRYIEGKLISTGYTNKRFDLSKLEKVWFVFEPFSKFKPVAHTYFVFDFTDQEPVVVSVEARREKGEKYSLLSGLFNQYELIYVWGTERDETVKRVALEDNKLYMYPLRISQKGAQKLFLQLAQTTQDLKKNPRFYNTLVSNCTNELAKSANKVKTDAIPFNLALIFPGFSVDFLYKLGYIQNNIPLEELSNRYYISDIVKEIYDREDFSMQLRARLINN